MWGRGSGRHSFGGLAVGWLGDCPVLRNGDQGCEPSVHGAISSSWRNKWWIEAGGGGHFPSTEERTCFSISCIHSAESHESWGGCGTADDALCSQMPPLLECWETGMPCCPCDDGQRQGHLPVGHYLLVALEYEFAWLVAGMECERDSSHLPLWLRNQQGHRGGGWVGRVMSSVMVGEIGVEGWLWAGARSWDQVWGGRAELDGIAPEGGRAAGGLEMSLLALCYTEPEQAREQSPPLKRVMGEEHSWGSPEGQFVVCFLCCWISGKAPSVVGVGEGVRWEQVHQ